jgi:hypothetical protein
MGGVPVDERIVKRMGAATKALQLLVAKFSTRELMGALAGRHIREINTPSEEVGSEKRLSRARTSARLP